MKEGNFGCCDILGDVLEMEIFWEIIVFLRYDSGIGIFKVKRGLEGFLEIVIYMGIG